MGRFLYGCSINSMYHVLYLFVSTVQWEGDPVEACTRLVHRDSGAQRSGGGLSLVPKLRYEHIYLTSFSKMRVDLAAQISYKYFQVQVLYIYFHL